MDIEHLSGQVLGQYELRELLGVGGMGAVYRAYQATLEREVAVKILSPLLGSEPSYVKRFEREAKTAASLEHAHIVPVYDYGTQEDISYIVMRLLTGGSLEQRIRSRVRLASLQETSLLLGQLALALDYAHRRNVIHRDIKTSNVMFDDQNRAVLVDFGIARLLEISGDLTTTGTLMGTPSYMAPEQWRDESVSTATDLYALGILVYATLTGKLPFEASTPHALMHKHLHEKPPPPQLWRPDLSDMVKPVLEKALAKNPDERYPSAVAFAQAFRNATTLQRSEKPATATQATVGRPPVSPRRTTRAVAVVRSAAVPKPQEASIQPRPRRNALRYLGALSLLLALGISIAFALMSIPGKRQTGDAVTDSPIEVAVVEMESVTRTPAAQFERTVSSSSQSEVAAPLSGVEIVSATRTGTPPPTDTPSATPSATASLTMTPSPTLTDTPSATPSATASPTMTPTQTSTPTATATHTPTPLPTAIPERMTISGTLSAGQQLGEYVFDWLAGDIVRIVVTADGFDPILILTTSNGELLAENDDCGGNLSKSCLEWWQLPSDGSYRVVVDSFHAHSEGIYTIDITYIRNCADNGPLAIVSGTDPNINLRGGPGTAYPIIGTVQTDDCLAIVGRAQADSWLRVRTASSRTGWITVALVKVLGDLAAIPLETQ